MEECYLCEITLTEEIPEEGWTIENQAHDLNNSTSVRFPHDSDTDTDEDGERIICMSCFDSKMAMSCRACGDYFVDKDLVHSKSFDTESGRDQWDLDLTMCYICYDAGALPLVQKLFD